MKINLNDTIEVKLNELGLRILHDYCDYYNFPEAIKSFVLNDESGENIFKFPIWKFAHIFGGNCIMGRKEFCEMTVDLKISE